MRTESLIVELSHNLTVGQTALPRLDLLPATPVFAETFLTNLTKSADVGESLVEMEFLKEEFVSGN